MVGLTKRLLGGLAGGPYYVRIQRDRLSVRDASGDRYFDDAPFVALSNDEPPIVRSIGQSAKTASDRVVNPFGHPRLVVTDFLIAEKLLQHAFSVVAGKRLLAAAPVAIMHTVDDLEGGLTDIERRALHELAMGAGAREAYVWEGRELTNEELRSGVYRQGEVA